MRRSFLFQLYFFIVLFSAKTAFSDIKTERYKGIAKTPSGEVSYIERHKARFSKTGSILTAVTRYETPSGELIGVMSSDFSRSLTAPSYSFKDERDKSEHGIRYREDQLILFYRLAGDSEKTKALHFESNDEFLVIGCQGLHYYLSENLSNLTDNRNLKLLIPGRLTYYNFRLRPLSREENISRLRVDVRSLFLRAFVPSLELEYDSEKKRLLRYDGISNITDHRGRPQRVIIDYVYES